MKRILPFFFTLLLVLGASADGGFIVPPNHAQMYEPTQEAIIVFDGHRETLIIKPTFSGELHEFAWVVPVPSYPVVEEAKRELFHELYRLTQPVYERTQDFGLVGFGKATQPEDIGIYLHEREQIGIYDTVIMSGYNEDNFMTWFQREGFHIPDSARPIIREYMAKNWVFVVMRITPSEYQGQIQPMQFTFDSPEPVYPLKISSINKGASKISIYAFTDYLMQEEGFEVTYAKNLEAKDIIHRYPELNKLLQRGYFLTKMERTMWPADMTSDLVLGKDTTFNAWTGKEESQEYIPKHERPFDWPLFFVVNILATIGLLVGALIFRFLFNHFQKKKEKLSVKRALAYGAIVLVLLNLALFSSSLGDIGMAIFSLPVFLIELFLDVALPLLGVAALIVLPLIALGLVFYAIHWLSTKLVK